VNCVRKRPSTNFTATFRSPAHGGLPAGCCGHRASKRVSVLAATWTGGRIGRRPGGGVDTRWTARGSPASHPVRLAVPLLHQPIGAAAALGRCNHTPPVQNLFTLSSRRRLASGAAMLTASSPPVLPVLTAAALLVGCLGWPWRPCATATARTPRPSAPATMPGPSAPAPHSRAAAPLHLSCDAACLPLQETCRPAF